jgi:hypothetical protein
MFLAKVRLKWFENPPSAVAVANLNAQGGLLESIHAAAGTQPPPPVRTIDIDPAAASRPPPDAATGAPCPGVPVMPDAQVDPAPPFPPDETPET